MEQIGEVEVMRVRVYPLDAAAGDHPNATTVVVEPRRYPLYRDGLSYFWMLTGQINTGRMHRLGDGIFSMMPADEAGGSWVRFPSRVFGPDEWAEFRNDPACADGPDQRLRIHEVASRSGE